MKTCPATLVTSTMSNGLEKVTNTQLILQRWPGCFLVVLHCADLQHHCKTTKSYPTQYQKNFILPEPNLDVLTSLALNLGKLPSTIATLIRLLGISYISSWLGLNLWTARLWPRKGAWIFAYHLFNLINTEIQDLSIYSKVGKNGKRRWVPLHFCLKRKWSMRYVLFHILVFCKGTFFLFTLTSIPTFSRTALQMSEAVNDYQWHQRVFPQGRIFASAWYGERKLSMKMTGNLEKTSKVVKWT